MQATAARTRSGSTKRPAACLNLSNNQCILLSAYLSTLLSTHLSIYLSTYLSIYLSIYRSIYLYLYQYEYLGSVWNVFGGASDSEGAFSGPERPQKHKDPAIKKFWNPSFKGPKSHSVGPLLMLVWSSCCRNFGSLSRSSCWFNVPELLWICRSHFGALALWHPCLPCRMPGNEVAFVRAEVRVRG